MEFKIRVAEESDFETIIDLIKEFALFEKLPHKMVNSVERMNSEKELFNCFIAETNEKQIVGYATFFFTYHTWIGKCLYMDDLYVKESFRSVGIGKSLLNSVITFAKESKCHKLRWQVSNWNINAQDFYKSLGAEIDNVELNCDLLLDKISE
ncbi:GNAT family N-acetyltransferase [Chryseosolibacter indicus]|uniref:GNAT family N-acetyltransferase n=1 Tax=Chryseosolibacter indicus TaxID=2782351 RepID=A0ABS5VYQ4_9BACT|nr:GNAT family N-acetyltransferase [Chryseosolibacter indicus]MBT1705136.1 GNAT family N-acetyltransferase [Chryseosolibacter indicus]